MPAFTVKAAEPLTLAAGPDADDLDGCEDLTVAILNRTDYVYYTGWNQIAFAASSVKTQDAASLYYRVADHYLMRATLGLP